MKILFILNYRAGSTLWRFISGKQAVNFHNSGDGIAPLVNPEVQEASVPLLSQHSFWVATSTPYQLPCEHINYGHPDYIQPGSYLNMSWYTYIGDWWGECSGQEVPYPYEIQTPMRWGPDELKNLPGEWKFVAFVRDGRNQIESLRCLKGGYEEAQIKKYGEEDYFLRLCRGWRNRTRMILDARAALPDKYQVVYFEDFMKDPVSTLAEIHEWLGFPINRGFVRRAFELSRKEGTNKRHSSFEGKGNLHERWISWTWEKQIFADNAQKELEELGYR